MKYSTINIFSLPFDFLNIFFLLAYFIIRIQYTIHITYKICINRLFMLLVRFPVNSKLLVVKGLEESKVICGFLTMGGSASLTPELFKGQLYLPPVTVVRIESFYVPDT